MDRLALRLRAILDRQFLFVVAALVLLVLLGGWLTYTAHISPGTTTEEQTGASWQTTGQYDHSATVQRSNSVFSRGTELTNRSVYFTDVSPQLNGTFRFTYAASETGDLNQSISLSLVIRGVEQRGESQNQTVLWQTTRLINDRVSESANPDEATRVPFSIDVKNVANRTEQINEELGGPPGQTEVFVRATVEYQGTVNGNAVDRTKTYALPIGLDGDTYTAGSTDPETERHETIQTVTVQQTSGPSHAIGGPSLLFASLVGLIGLLRVYQQGKLGLSERERERLEYEDDKGDFEEWISTVRLPDEAFDRPQAEATSLSALVDFAIDTNNSVIEDPNEGAYYVLHEDYLYAYRPAVNHNEENSVTVTDNGHGEPDGYKKDPAESDFTTNEADAADNGSDSPDDTSVEDGV
jgi:hypothetical protein